MKYIIPVIIPNYSILNSINLDKNKEIIDNFICSTINKENTFEVHESKYELRNIVYNDFHRYQFIDKIFCYDGAMITRWDFDYDINTFFIEVVADDKFNPNGNFYFRAVKSEIVDEEPTIRIVGLDYVVKGD